MKLYDGGVVIVAIIFALVAAVAVDKQLNSSKVTTKVGNTINSTVCPVMKTC